jgi:tRNA-dihydrouridine synthase
MTNIEFAPLQGYTDAAYRYWHNRLIGGISCYYSPFIRIEKSDIRAKDLRDILPENNEGLNLVPQIIVNGKDELDFLSAKIRELGYSRIDINLGCPFPLQTKKGRGAALLSDPQKVQELMEAIKDNDDIHYSVKMRLGMSSAEEFYPLIDIINHAPLHHVTLHPRVATQQYKGNVDMLSFERISGEITHPLIYNGDITNLGEINSIDSRYATLSAIMIGRGLLSDPCLSYEYVNNVQLSDKEKIAKILELHAHLLEHYSARLQGDSQLLVKMKTFWEYLEPLIGRKSAKLIKKSINMAKYDAAVASISCN